LYLEKSVSGQITAIVNLQIAEILSVGILRAPHHDMEMRA
jgi:hypothetical protein